MKIYFSFILTICVLLSSCSTDSNDVITPERTSNLHSALIDDMSNFNDSLLSTLPSTRVSNKRILDNMSIVVADAIGAYGCGKIGAKVGSFFGHPIVGASIGALIGGAYSSYDCYNRLNSTRAIVSQNQLKPIQVAAAYIPALKDESLIEDNLPKKINLKYISDNEENIAIGAKHNIIVRNLQANNFSLNSEVQTYLSNDEIDILSSKEFILGFDSITCSINNYVIKEKIPQNIDNSTSSLLMNLFAKIINTYSDQTEDVDFIINKYLEAVQNTSELSKEEKDNIYKALSVAASSFEYWNK